MLKGLHRAAALAEDVGDLLDRQVTDDPQREDLALVGGQIGEHLATLSASIACSASTSALPPGTDSVTGSESSTAVGRRLRGGARR